MSTKDDRIARLKRGIASEDTPAHVKEQMQGELDKLLAPEPEPTPEVDHQEAARILKAEEKAAKLKANRDKSNAKAKAARDAKKAPVAVPPPPVVLTAEEKADLIEKYKRKKERKLAKQEE